VNAVASGEAPRHVADTFEVGDGENQGDVGGVVPYESFKAGFNVTFGLVFELLDEVLSHRDGANTRLTKMFRDFDYPRESRTIPELQKRGKGLFKTLTEIVRRVMLKPIQ
jgi:hypothetical protein